MRKLLFLAISCTPIVAIADGGSDSLGGSINAICLAATPGTAFYDRCQELLNSPDFGAGDSLAAAQGLEEFPDQGRASTRSQARKNAMFSLWLLS